MKIKSSDVGVCRLNESSAGPFTHVDRVEANVMKREGFASWDVGMRTMTLTAEGESVFDRGNKLRGQSCTPNEKLSIAVVAGCVGALATLQSWAPVYKSV